MSRAVDVNGEFVAANHAVPLPNKSLLRCGETYLYFLLPADAAVAQHAAAMRDGVAEPRSAAAALPAPPLPTRAPAKKLSMPYKSVLDMVR